MLKNNTPKSVGKRPKTAHKRKSISLGEKLIILDRLRAGERPSAIARSLGLNESTIRTIQQNERKIRHSVSAGESVSALRVARVRNALIQQMECELFTWISEHSSSSNGTTDSEHTEEQQQQQPKLQTELNGSMIRAEALRIFERLKQEGGDQMSKSVNAEDEQKSGQRSLQFLASKGWLENFKQRNGIQISKVPESGGSADCELTHSYLEELSKFFNDDDSLNDEQMSTEPMKSNGLSHQQQQEAETFTKSVFNVINEPIDNDPNSVTWTENTTTTSTPRVVHETDHSDYAMNFAGSGKSLTAMGIQEGLEMAERLRAHFIEIDPSIDRFNRFKQQLEIALEPYIELQKEILQGSKQRLITEFLMVEPDDKLK